VSKAEKIKEQIGWLKIVFGLLTAILVSLVGFIATSYKSAEPVTLVLATGLVVFMSMSIS